MGQRSISMVLPGPSELLPSCRAPLTPVLLRPAARPCWRPLQASGQCTRWQGICGTAPTAPPGSPSLWSVARRRQQPLRRPTLCARPRRSRSGARTAVPRPSFIVSSDAVWATVTPKGQAVCVALGQLRRGSVGHGRQRGMPWLSAGHPQGSVCVVGRVWHAAAPIPRSGPVGQQAAPRPLRAPREAIPLMWAEP